MRIAVPTATSDPRASTLRGRRRGGRYAAVPATPRPAWAAAAGAGDLADAVPLTCRRARCWSSTRRRRGPARACVVRRRPRSWTARRRAERGAAVAGHRLAALLGDGRRRARATSRRSASAPARAASRASASGWPPPRRSPGRWASRSSASRRPTRSGAPPRPRRARTRATIAVVQPAGARDHYLALPGAEPRLVPPGADLAATRSAAGPRSPWTRIPIGWRAAAARAASIRWRPATRARDGLGAALLAHPRGAARGRRARTTSRRSCRPTWRCRGASPAAAEAGVVARPPLRLRVEPMTVADIPAVHASSGPASPCRGRPTRSARSWRPTGWRTTWWSRAGDETVAYGGIWLMVDEAHVTTFAVLPAWRRQGVGGAADARADGPRRELGARVVTLEVRLSATSRRARSTSASASARSASGRATTRTTARTR